MAWPLCDRKGCIPHCHQTPPVTMQTRNPQRGQAIYGPASWSVSGRVQDWERMRCPGTCGALTYLQGVTQGEWVPAECLSRSVIIMYKSKYIHGGLYRSRREKKAALSSYSSQ